MKIEDREVTKTMTAVSEIECFECGEELKKCSKCEQEFHAGDVIYCSDLLPVKHYCSDCANERDNNPRGGR